MNANKAKTANDDYLRATHRLGRAVSVITLALLLGAPFVMGRCLGALPNLATAARGFLPWAWYGRYPAWWNFWYTRPCWAPAEATWPSSPAT